MTETNEEAVVSGLLDFDVDGRKRTVPELKWRANRAWQAKLQTTFAALVGIPDDTPEGLAAMADAQRSLIAEYDVTHALGDLEDATERELDAIYNGLVKVAFPLAQSQTALMVGIIRGLVARSAQENSTNGPSPTGTSPDPTILKDHLPSARPGSSSRRRKSA